MAIPELPSNSDIFVYLPFKHTPYCCLRNKVISWLASTNFKKSIAVFIFQNKFHTQKSLEASFVSLKKSKHNCVIQSNDTFFLLTIPTTLDTKYQFAFPDFFTLETYPSNTRIKLGFKFSLSSSLKHSKPGKTHFFHLLFLVSCILVSSSWRRNKNRPGDPSPYTGVFLRQLF